MSYYLFLDDERYPPDDGKLWHIARTMDDVKWLFERKGCPSFISFDHDLGDDQPSGMDIAKWIIESDLDCEIIPPNFAFYVHSQNPVGKANIEGLLNQYLAQRLA